MTNISSYGTAAIDVWEKFGINNMAIDPWVKKRHHNGNLYVIWPLASFSS